MELSNYGAHSWQVWNKFVTFKEELSNETKVVILSIHDMASDKEEAIIFTKQTLAALNALGELQRCIRSFGKNLLQYFIK